MPYFTAAEARAQEDALSNTTTYPDALIDAMCLTVEDALEHACGLAFLPRTATDEQHDGAGGDADLVLDWAMPAAVTAASVSGEALDASALTDLVLYRDGRVYSPSGWSAGRGNVLITYTHGFATVPGRVKRAAIQLTKRFLLDSPVSDRATSLINEDGTTQYLITAGVRGAVFDLPEANAVIQEYGVRASVG